MPTTASPASLQAGSQIEVASRITSDVTRAGPSFFVFATGPDDAVVGMIPVEPEVNGDLRYRWDGRWILIGDNSTGLAIPALVFWTRRLDSGSNRYVAWALVTRNGEEEVVVLVVDFDGRGWSTTVFPGRVLKTGSPTPRRFRPSDRFRASPQFLLSQPSGGLPSVRPEKPLPDGFRGEVTLAASGKLAVTYDRLSLLSRGSAVKWKVGFITLSLGGRVVASKLAEVVAN
jgi:hypothetical protein